MLVSSVVARIGVANPDAMAAAMRPSGAAARITGQVIAVDGGFTSVQPLVK